MNFRTLKVSNVLVAGLLPMLGLFLLMPSPTLALEKVPFGSVTASEVQEFLRFKTGEDEESIVLRLANATLVGQGTGGLCGASSQDPCPLDAHAQSSVDLSTGQGPVSGTFNLLTDINPGSPLLMDLVRVGTVKIDGTLNLGPALLFAQSGGAAGAPVASVNGTWKSRELRAHGEFAGMFLIPIPIQSPLCAMGWAYYNPLATPVLFQCLTLQNFSLGAPVVQLRADLAKDGRGNRHDED